MIHIEEIAYTLQKNQENAIGGVMVKIKWARVYEYGECVYVSVTCECVHACMWKHNVPMNELVCLCACGKAHLIHHRFTVLYSLTWENNQFP